MRRNSLVVVVALALAACTGAPEGDGVDTPAPEGPATTSTVSATTTMVPEVASDAEGAAEPQPEATEGGPDEGQVSTVFRVDAGTTVPVYAGPDPQGDVLAEADHETLLVGTGRFFPVSLFFGMVEVELPGLWDPMIGYVWGSDAAVLALGDVRADEDLPASLADVRARTITEVGWRVGSELASEWTVVGKSEEGDRAEVVFDIPEADSFGGGERVRVFVEWSSDAWSVVDVEVQDLCLHHWDPTLGSCG